MKNEKTVKEKAKAKSNSERKKYENFEVCKDCTHKIKLKIKKSLFVFV